MLLHALNLLNLVVFTIGVRIPDYCGTNNLAYESPFAFDRHLSRDVIEETAIKCSEHVQYESHCNENSNFIHGVASGDPFDDSVVIWTRITADEWPINAIINITYIVALDEKMNDVITEGFVLTSHTIDYTVKVVVDDLLPASRYYYQFYSCEKRIASSVGQTKTLPASDSFIESVSIATVNSAMYSYGTFTAYAKLAARVNEVDVVLHIGDYIYEYGNVSPDDADWFSKKQSREPIGNANIPPFETVTLTDYRMRYAQYRSDPDLQELHKAIPFIVIPDNHEIAENINGRGTENDGDGKSPWGIRTAAGLRAWFEWIPARQYPDKQHFYRDFKFGDLVHLVMLDARHDNREDMSKVKLSFDNVPSKQSLAGERKIMSSEQMEWVTNTVKQSTGHWKVIGSQVPFTDIIEGGRLLEISALLALHDSWAGFRGSQKAMLAAIENSSNVVILTGNIHTSAALNVFKKSNGEFYGVEYVAPSITAAGLGEVLQDGLHLSKSVQELVRKQIINSNELLYDIDLYCHGYLITTYTITHMTAKFFCVEDIHDSNNKNETESWMLMTCSGTSKVLDKATNSCPVVG